MFKKEYFLVFGKYACSGKTFFARDESDAVSQLMQDNIFNFENLQYSVLAYELKDPKEYKVDANFEIKEVK